jgi:hypothetical protein
VRETKWSKAVALGSLAFVEKVKTELGAKALHRDLEQVDGTYALRESGEAYSGQFDTENEGEDQKTHFHGRELPQLR